MDKLRVILADDDISSRLLLTHFIQLIPDYVIVGEAANGEDLIKLIMQEKPDIALVDIDMPNISGMEAVKACKDIQPFLQVIFTTCYDEYAVEAFNLAATDYVVKPIERARLFVALDKAKQTIQLTKKQEESIRESTNKLQIKSNQSILYLSIEDILFIEREGRKTILQTINKRYETTESLQELEGKLPTSFFRTHRSYIVNLKKIERIESSGETYLACFSNKEKAAHISKLKVNEVFNIMENL